MSDVIVSQLAESIGTSVDRLLKQMEDAGLPQRKQTEKVSDEQKEVLLQFLRESHGAGGEADGGPKKITLKRKTVSTLKTGSGAAKKIVSVEVRKKRTYVKRDDIGLQFGNQAARLIGARCRPDHPDVLGLIQNVGEQGAHRRRIVHDQNTGFVHSNRPSIDSLGRHSGASELCLTRNSQETAYRH